MITIQIDTREIDRLKRSLDDMAQKQVPFATARALTATARAAQEKLKDEIGSVFDRPTPWIRNSPFVTPASKAKLEAVVGIKDQGSRATPAHYLRQHITAGDRGNKPMEKAMRAMGILDGGWLVVPSSNGVRKDAFGNVPRSTIASVLRGVASKATVTAGGISSRLFVIAPGVRSHLSPGIWSAARAGDQSILRPVFLFIRRAAYKKVLDLPAIVEEVANREFPEQFNRALQSALDTAR